MTTFVDPITGICEPVISVIIPTYNRAHILEKTLPTYTTSKCVGEIIVVSDGSTDDTIEIVNRFIRCSELRKVVLISHTQRMGAAAARLTGVNNSKYKYVMFGEDDVYIEEGYCQKLLYRLSMDLYGFSSGRIIYLKRNETPEAAKSRFGFGFNNMPLLDEKLFKINQEKCLTSDCETVYSHALYMAERSTLLDLGFDQFYRNGAGYREETDTQVRGFIGGKTHVIAHDAYCFHMSFEDTPTGGQRTSRLKQWYWNNILNSYFLDKNYKNLKSRNIFQNESLFALKLYFLSNQNYVFLIRPTYLRVKSTLIKAIKLAIGKKP